MIEYEYGGTPRWGMVGEMTDAELVKACAEKVMGWEVVSQVEFIRRELWTIGKTAVSVDGELWLVTRRSTAADKHWNPLASDSDCFMLVDVLSKSGFSFGFWDVPPISSHPGPVACFSHSVHPPEHTNPAAVCAPDRRRAIVLAALKTVGVLV